MSEVATDRLVLVATSPRLPPGLLSWPAWAALRAGRVFVGDGEHPALPALVAAGIEVEVLGADPPALRAQARGGHVVVWLAGTDGDTTFVRGLATLVAREAASGVPVELEVIYGSYDPPGAKLLDVVAVMDRLRSPGGCPWDAEQTHASLAPHLLEEAYEAYQAIEDDEIAGRDSALAEELGDVLLQVAFHARLAEDLPEDERWSIDDVAAGLVDKLTRRHPHVFAATTVTGAAQVVKNWEAIKAAEKGRTSVTEGLPLTAPALSLATRLQDRASQLGLPPELVSAVLAAADVPAVAVAAAAAAVEESPSPETVGDLLFAAVALARSYDIDAEVALRGVARRFRDRLAAVERAVLAEGGQAQALSPTDWLERWRQL